MKRSLIILFLSILVLCGMFLQAASNSKKGFTVEKANQRVTKAEVTRYMDLFPNNLLLF